MPSSQGRALSRRYTLIASASVIPLIIMIVFLAVFQYTTQRAQLLDELRDEAIKHNVFLSNVMKTVRDHGSSLAAWAELYAAEGGAIPAPLWEATDARLFLRGAAAGERVGIAQSLVQHMRLGHRTMPYLRWSFFLSGEQDFFSMFPLAEVEELGGSLRSASPADISDVAFGHELFQRGLPANNAARSNYWTEAYLDPAGAGWMVAHGTPVDAGGEFAGVIGTAVLLDFLTGFLRAFDYPCGQLWLVTEQGQLLAAPDGRVIAGLDLLELDEVLPAPLADVSFGRLVTSLAAFHDFDGAYAFAQPVGVAPWHLLFVATSAELNGLLLPRFIPYGIILAGLVITLILAQLLRQKMIVGPALALADYVKAESQDAYPALPQVPTMWTPWVQAVADAFAAQREAHKRIRDSEQHFRTIAESHPVPVAIVEPDGGRVLHASRAFADLLGISLDQANGIDIKQFYVNLKDRGHLIRTLRDRGGIQTFEHQVRRADGTVFPVSVTSRLIEYEGREAIVSGVLDLTEQKRAEAEIARQREALRVSEQRFKTIAEAHPVPVGIVRRSDRKVLYASPAFVELLGTSLEQLYARDPRDFYANPEERLKISEALRQNRVVVNMEFAARRHDGTTFPAAMTCKVIEYEGEEAVVAGIVDLTELKHVEQQLRESEQRFKVFAEAHPVPVIIVTLHDAKVIYASRPCQDLLGTEELLGRSILPFYANSDDRAPFVERVHQEDGVDGFEVRLRRADGSEFWAAFTSRLITFEGRDAMVTAIVDLTEPKRAEAEIARQQEALHQSEKMNALGSLLANVAHELNNPLSVVVGYATMMRDLTTDAANQERAAKIQAAAERCARIVRTFLAMARQKPETRGPVQLNQVVHAALEIVGYGLRTADVDVTLELDPDLPELQGDTDQLTLVVMNLIVNAQHALQTISGPRQVEITTGGAEDGLWLELSDNGPGVPTDIVTRIFDPFFTTKPQGIGTGIGLSVCHTIVTAHEGEISVASRCEGGALFRISLPLGEPAEAAPIEPTAEPPAPVVGRILVVEDEVEIADMLAEVLERDGHEVTLAASGREALARLETHAADLIVSDLRMPDLDGPNLHGELTRHKPELADRMLFITGDTLALDLAEFLDATELPVLEKPLDPYELRLKVRTLLAAHQKSPGSDDRRSALAD